MEKKPPSASAGTALCSQSLGTPKKAPGLLEAGFLLMSVNSWFCFEPTVRGCGSSTHFVLQ